jgi:hypothetical protein
VDIKPDINPDLDISLEETASPAANIASIPADEEENLASFKL